MPTYEYACRSCGEHLEVVQSFTDDSLTACPSCGGELRKVFGSIGIVFKGSGFYKNDSRSTGKRDGAAAKPETAAAEEGAGATSADASSTTGDGSKADGGKPETKPAASGSGEKKSPGKPAPAKAAAS
ncbi:MAG: FmdB family zinc ribbon protein [Acidimicrobiales bacterium]